MFAKECGLRKSWGDISGTLLALLAALRTFRPMTYQLRIDDRKTVVCRHVYNLFVGKGRYVASGIRLNLDVTPDDGRLHILSVAERSRFRLLTRVMAAYTGMLPRVYQPIYASEVQVTAVSGCRELEYDSDPHGRLPASIRVLPRALRVVGITT